MWFIICLLWSTDKKEQAFVSLKGSYIMIDSGRSESFILYYLLNILLSFRIRCQLNDAHESW